MELDLPFGDSKHFSISNGEVSYGDEPVFDRKSRATGSRDSSCRSDESQSQSSDIDRETARVSGQWFYLMNSPHSVPTFTSSSVNFHNSPDGSQGRSNLNTTNSIAYNTSNTTHDLLSRIDLPPNNTNRQSINHPTDFKPLTSIENSDDSNSRLVQESSLSNSRPIDPDVSTNSLASHKPVHTISSSSPEPGSYTELSPITQNHPQGKMPPKKRKNELGGTPKAKKQKGNKIVIKSKRVPKSKAEKPEPVGKIPLYFCAVTKQV
jgi:hypothetical protein